MYEPIKDETKKLYTKIWTHYSVGRLNYQQLGELFSCSEDTISNAIQWCAENRTQLDPRILTEAAKETLENRIRELRSDAIRIKEGSSINWNAYIGMNKLIKENEELLWKLQGVIQDKSIVTISTTQVNQVVKAKDEAMEKLTDDKRRELATRIREVIKGQEDH